MYNAGFDWLSGHGIWAIISCPRNRDHLFFFCLFLQCEIITIKKYFLIVFNKTIIPLMLIEYEMIIANSALWRVLLAIYLISYPTRARGTIVD